MGRLSYQLLSSADVTHILTDVNGLAMALIATWLAASDAAGRSFGYYQVECWPAAAVIFLLFGDAC